LLAREALEILELRPGATPAEVKAAYRDLVKVWHPDRFGSDVRLRSKAEDKLKELNEAYRILEGGSSASDMDAPVPDPGSPVWHATSTPPQQQWGRKNVDGRGGVAWLMGGIGALAGVLVVLLAVHHRAAPLALPLKQAPQVVANAPVVGAPRTKGAERSPDRTASEFQVRHFAPAESERMEAACSVWTQQTAYQGCIRAQVALLAHPESQPDLSGMTAVERESVESVCTNAKGGYNRCATAQVAAWWAEPARPELSRLGEADRQAVETACNHAKQRDGVAAYDRCRVKFAKALAETH
jgi:DnaJ domain